MPKTLLLADDSVTIQKVVGISFANEDVVLLTVDNGDDAVVRDDRSVLDLLTADYTFVNERLAKFVSDNARKLNDAIVPERDHEFDLVM
ncbi:MAG: DUF1592 domain-containing protein [Nitrospiraceae bacterium]|nr:DUF1592 domain-containing protein [Nitrospiraceae bacterium]